MITIQDLTFWYSKKRPVLNSINMELETGHIYGLLGKNGTGKTTLLKLLCGLASPKSGIVDMDGINPFHRTPPFLQEIFLVPEEISVPSLKPSRFAEIYAPFYPRFDNSQFVDLLVKFEVDVNQNLTKMSLGQRKKALISFAIACNTKYLFLDEPTNGLDIPSKGVFRSLLASVFSEEKTILLSTHQVRDLQSLIDNVIILEGHKIVLNQSLDKVSKTFTFGHSLIFPASGEVLFKANTELGQTTMMLNTPGEPGNVDLETLFNASIEIPEKLATHLRN